MSKFTIKDQSVPAGVYTAVFDGVEETHHDVYGDGLTWKFVIARGRFRDRTVTRVTKPEPSLRNSCGKFLAALVGKAPTDGMEIDPDEYEGQRYIVTVADAKNGGTRAESFIRGTAMEDEAPTAPQPAAREPGEDDAETLGAVPTGDGGDQVPWEGDDQQ